jgi:hypothetical protein
MLLTSFALPLNQNILFDEIAKGKRSIHVRSTMMASIMV